MSLSWPPVQKIGGVVSPHGIAAAGGFLAGAQLLLREVRRRGGLDPDVVVRALTWAAVGAIVGARADYLISHPRDFESVGEALRLWEGGLALFGGFIGGVLFALPTVIRARAHLPRLLDAAAPGFAIGVVIGRIGDLVIWDHLGDPATGWWKAVGLTIRKGYELAPGFGPSPAQPLPAGLTCVEAARDKLFYAGCTYHQPALYDLLGALVLLGVLLALRRRAKYRAGVAICIWGLWYGVQRLLIDVTRSIDERPLFGLTGTQLLGIVLATVCAATLLRIRLRGRGLQEAEGDPPSRLGSLVHPPPDAGQDGDSSDASITPSANPLA